MYTPLGRYLKIGDSSIHGQGLFAIIDIPAGTNLGASHVLIGKKVIARTPLGGFYNHSKHPNAEKEFKRMWFYPINVFLLKTTKKIKAGEEITVEYTLYDPTENQNQI